MPTLVNNIQCNVNSSYQGVGLPNEAVAPAPANVEIEKRKKSEITGESPATATVPYSQVDPEVRDTTPLQPPKWEVNAGASWHTRRQYDCEASYENWLRNINQMNQNVEEMEQPREKKPKNITQPTFEAFCEEIKTYVPLGYLVVHSLVALILVFCFQLPIPLIGFLPLLHVTVELNKHTDRQVSQSWPAAFRTSRGGQNACHDASESSPALNADQPVFFLCPDEYQLFDPG